MSREVLDLNRDPCVVILASGKGTTAEFLIRATQTGVLKAEVGAVISNNENAGVFDRVGQLNSQYGLDIHAEHISGQTHPKDATNNKYEQTDSESQAIYELAREVAENRQLLILLAGYLRKTRGRLLQEFGIRGTEPVIVSHMLNTHPAILPETQGTYGKTAHQRVAQLRLNESAQILHGVTDSYDTGPIYRINKFPVPVASENASREEIDEVAERIEEIAQNTEKAHLPTDTNDFLQEQKKSLQAQEPYSSLTRGGGAF